MSKIPLSGGFYQDSALQFDAQRSVNMYPVMSEGMGSKTPSKLKGAPGLKYLLNYVSIFDTVASTFKILDYYTASNGYPYIIVTYRTESTGLWEKRISTITGETYSTTGLGANTLEEPLSCKMIDNGITLCLVTGGESFFSDMTRPHYPSFVKITDPDFPSSVFDVTYKDTYFIFLDRDTDRFYISSSNASDPTDCINALDFGTVESNPDTLQGIESTGNEIAIFGTKTIEFFYNSGNADFPFTRNSGVTQEIGTVAKLSLSKINNEIYFIGSNSSGFGIVYRMNGYTPQRISNHNIERKLLESTNLGGAICYTYQESGNYFYSINAEGLDTTLVFDSQSGLWHERASLDVNGNYYKYPAIYSQFAFNKNTALNVEYTPDGHVGWFLREIKEDYYRFDTDGIYGGNSAINGTIRRERVLPHLTEERKEIQYNQIEFDIQMGVGLNNGNDNDVNPIIELYVSRDGGFTYGKPLKMNIGKIGEYAGRIRKQMLGTARDAVFKIVSSSKVQQEWFQAYIDFEVLSE